MHQLLTAGRSAVVRTSPPSTHPGLELDVVLIMLQWVVLVGGVAGCLLCAVIIRDGGFQSPPDDGDMALDPWELGGLALASIAALLGGAYGLGLRW